MLQNSVCAHVAVCAHSATVCNTLLPPAAVVLQACALAMTSAVGAPWVTKPGPLPNVSIPILDGIAPTTHVTSTECGNDCAFTNPKMWATAAVSRAGRAGRAA